MRGDSEQEEKKERGDPLINVGLTPCSYAVLHPCLVNGSIKYEGRF